MCPEKDALLQERMRATNDYATAVTALCQGTEATHAALYRVTEEARIEAERARLAYERHVARHRC